MWRDEKNGGFPSFEVAAAPPRTWSSENFRLALGAFSVRFHYLCQRKPPRTMNASLYTPDILSPSVRDLRSDGVSLSWEAKITPPLLSYSKTALYALFGRIFRRHPALVSRCGMPLACWVRGRLARMMSRKCPTCGCRGQPVRNRRFAPSRAGEAPALPGSERAKNTEQIIHSLTHKTKLYAL